MSLVSTIINAYLIELLMTGTVEFVIADNDEPVWCIIQLTETGYYWESGNAMGMTCNGFDAIWKAAMQGSSPSKGRGLEVARSAFS